MHPRSTFTTTARMLLIAIGLLAIVSLLIERIAFAPPSNPSGAEYDDAQVAWEALQSAAEDRLRNEGAAAIPHVLNELLAFAKQYEGTKEAVIALLNHGQLAISADKIDLAEDSLQRARRSASDPKIIAAIDAAIAQIAIRPGRTPPDFTATTLDGRTVSLSDFKGKVLLLDFWATWCIPCLKELPTVRRVYEKYHDDGLEILSVSLDRKEATLRGFLRRTELAWTHVYNAGSPRGEDPATIYSVTAIPMTVLIDRDGRIAAMDMRGDQLEIEVKRALGGVDEAGAFDPGKLDIGRSRGPRNPNLGLLDRTAPRWNVDRWFNLAEGRPSIDINDYRGKVVYLYGFQSWCPGCHAHGFPTLQELIKRFEGEEDVAFVAVQTTFEGFQTNTAEKALKTAQRYDLDIPIGHSGSRGRRSRLMNDYRTGGTPWTVIIDRNGIVRFNDFHITPDQAATLMDRLLAKKPR